MPYLDGPQFPPMLVYNLQTNILAPNKIDTNNTIFVTESLVSRAENNNNTLSTVKNLYRSTLEVKGAKKRKIIMLVRATTMVHYFGMHKYTMGD